MKSLFHKAKILTAHVVASSLLLMPMMGQDRQAKTGTSEQEHYLLEPGSIVDDYGCAFVPPGNEEAKRGAHVIMTHVVTKNYGGEGSQHHAGYIEFTLENDEGRYITFPVGTNNKLDFSAIRDFYKLVKVDEKSVDAYLKQQQELADRLGIEKTAMTQPLRAECTEAQTRKGIQTAALK